MQKLQLKSSDGGRSAGAADAAATDAAGVDPNSIQDVMEAAKAAAAEMAARGDIDAVVPLTHQDMADDVALSQSGLDFPVILGGHDHALITHEVEVEEEADTAFHFPLDISKAYKSSKHLKEAPVPPNIIILSRPQGMATCSALAAGVITAVDDVLFSELLLLLLVPVTAIVFSSPLFVCAGASAIPSCCASIPPSSTAGTGCDSGDAVSSFGSKSQPMVPAMDSMMVCSSASEPAAASSERPGERHAEAGS